MSTTNFKYTPEFLFEHTNGGLDIIHKYIPDSVGCEQSRKKFRLRKNEKTESCVLVKKDNVWFIKDFGDKSYSAISYVMQETGLEFSEALQRLYKEFNLDTDNIIYRATVEVKENTKLADDYFFIKLKDTYSSLDRVGRFITPETAEKYNFFEVEYYEKVITKKDTGKKALIKVIATDHYPIFCYSPNIEEWAKMYCPADTKYKHSYLGKKPERYVHGLQQFLDKCKKITTLITAEENKGDEANFEYIKVLKKDLSEQKLFIATGGSDGLNVASLNNDYNLIWYNSEAEMISYSELKQITQYTYFVYNVPDIDKAGKKYGNECAMMHWDLETIMLPADKMTKNGKDFRNWLDYYKNSSLSTIVFNFENLIATALKCKFFDVKKAKNGAYSYKINLSNLHYFLNVHNFYTYKLEHKHIDVATDDQIIFIRIEGNIVYKVTPREIRRFCLAYVKEKGQTLEVANLMLSTPYFNENHLQGLEDIKLNFKNHDANTQYFFFRNQVAKVTADGIKFEKHGNFENFAWNKQIVEHTIFPEASFFQHKKDELGNDRIDLLRSDCEYMNYLVNASRIYWRKELEESFVNEELAKAYHEENKFSLTGSNLNENEHLVQEKHFLNKCFSLGYLLHRYKQEDFAKCLYVMDDTPKDSDEDANGRTGKSVMFKGVDKLLQNRFLVDGKNRSITQDRHIFHGLYDTNEYIQIDDADKFLDFKFFYTKITNSIVVNPKNSQPYEIPFEDAPKIVYITNYGLPNITGSDMGRILFVSFSDYYHAKTEHYKQERRISHDFGGKNLFQDWDSKQWNLFYNFMLQCVELYLNNRGNEFQAPQDNITINNLRAGMGDNFEEWANSYFHDENLNRKIPRKELMNDYSDYVGGKSAKSSNAFKKALQSFCKIHGYTFNPATQQGTDGRIKDNVFDARKNANTTVECFYIECSTAPIPVATEQPQEEDLFNSDKEIGTDGLYF